MPPFIRSPYNYDLKEASDASSVGPGPEPSLTIQSQSEDADINVLMRRYGILGKFPENPFVPEYADYSNIGDFRSALHAMQRASESFYQYPSEFRARFQNDPQQFLDFCENPANLPEMRKLGLTREVSDERGSSSSLRGSGQSAQGVGEASGGRSAGDSVAAGGSPQADGGRKAEGA